MAKTTLLSFATIIPRYRKIWCRKVWAQILISTEGIIQDEWKIIQFELTCLEIWTSKCWAHEFLLRVSLRQCCTAQVVVVWVSNCCWLGPSTCFKGALHLQKQADNCLWVIEKEEREILKDTWRCKSGKRRVWCEKKENGGEGECGSKQGPADRHWRHPQCHPASCLSTKKPTLKRPRLNLFSFRSSPLLIFSPTILSPYFPWSLSVLGTGLKSIVRVRMQQQQRREVAAASVPCCSWQISAFLPCNSWFSDHSSPPPLSTSLLTTLKT